VKPPARAELHCHLDGVVDAEMLADIERAGIALPLGAAELERAYPVHDLDSFKRWFDVTEVLEGSLDGFEPVLARHVERLVAQGVVYTEIMIGSSELPRTDATSAMRAHRRWLDRLAAGRIEVQLVLAVSRMRTPESMAALCQSALPLFDERLLVGIALAGWPEAGRPASAYRDTFRMLNERGVGIEIHAGEWAGPESVWDAIDHGYARRLGHAVGAFGDPRLLDAIGERGIHLEMCLTSNVCTGAVGRIEDHPLPRARELGLSVSLATDDPGAFRCTVASEHALAARVFGFDERDFHAMTAAALAARFGPVNDGAKT
jgi:adenosine deaminase